ncbi:P2X purinoceptor 7-like [Bufo bufo]|uniref:P2X purinoceptor 7-like n=1 Tax=Bufo bufo TaxID=8384 RepID=UPI001ABE1BA1|nr:P2X purinoceptor 7-like [Bufo bufo]XP_040282309.1 P2X purinoceptor 7-like [Bufo bufo]
MADTKDLEDDIIVPAVSSEDPISRSPDLSEAKHLCPSSPVILQEAGSSALEQPAPVRLMNTSWCQCANCISLPTEMESVCCKEIEKIKGHLEGRSCITEHPLFKLFCQNEEVVNINLRIIHRFPPPDAEKNRYLRRVCYRFFSAWIHGYRGEGDKKPIPACVVHKVRNAFPGLQNVFTGFRFTGDPPAESMAWE